MIAPSKFDPSTIAPSTATKLIRYPTKFLDTEWVLFFYSGINRRSYRIDLVSDKSKKR